jgi:hypothetical protein
VIVFLGGLMINSSGILHYGPDIRAIVTVDQSIVSFYKALIPKYYNVERQRYNAHITVIRFGIEIPKYMAYFGKYEGEEINFEYDTQIRFDGKYYYLQVYSKRIENIRLELGLPKFRRDNCYHITIGNNKNV